MMRKKTEEALPDKRLILDNLAKGLQLFGTAFDFYDMYPCITWVLKLKQWKYHINTSII